MHRSVLLTIAVIASLTSCLPTRNGTSFNDDGTANNTNANNTNANNTNANNTNANNTNANNTTPNNVVVPDMDMPPNNMVTDMGNTNNNTTPMDMGADACMPEDNMTFCARQGASCGPFSSADNCGVMRDVDCGPCPGGGACTANVCAGCVPEDDGTFCQRLSVECGLFTELDNCRVQRSVNCGGCNGGGVACNLANTCVEANCKDLVDNDNSMGADCDDPSCLGQSCGNGNRVCQANGDCRN